MSVSFTGIDEFIGGLHKEVEELERRGAAEVRNAAFVVLRQLMSKTPVWEGETVRNYKAGVGAVTGSYSPPVGTEDPGDTNKMPLGPEPRRAANETAALADAVSVMAAYNNLEQSVFITNTVPGAKWDLVDNGEAPETSDKLRPRYPGVVSVLAVQSARSMLEHFK